MKATSLTGVPETMLLTLHNRASESMRKDHCYYDPEAERIYRSIDYDFYRKFGSPEASHSIRSKMFDEELNKFIESNPDGIIVNLGEGLETQRYRVQGDKVQWFCVEVPEAIEARELFIQADEQHIHVKYSALDPKWFDSIPEDRPIYFTAQGLLMYFKEEEVYDLLVAMSKRFRNAFFAFDVIPRWLSKKTMSPGGWQATKNYAFPPCPWGINRDEINPTLRKWIPDIQNIKVVPYQRYPRGIREKYIFYYLSRLPGIWNMAPTIVKTQFGRK